MKRVLSGWGGDGATWDRVLEAIGGLHSRVMRSEQPRSLEEAEFRIYSQFGEDGIVQFLIHRIPIENETFIEFGVQDYRESNTRFLLVHDGWRGLILDSGSDHIKWLERTDLLWRHSLDAVTAKVTRDNVNELFTSLGFEGDIGLLSIDIDGNDYWVLQAVEAVTPRIVITEYNSTFGHERAVTIPYREDFNRTEAHPSNLYWGASLAALTHVAKEKGYSLVGGNRAGNNAFFVRDDVLGDLSATAPREAWRDAHFRESLGDKGELTYLSSRKARIEEISALPLLDLETNQRIAVGDLL